MSAPRPASSFGASTPALEPPPVVPTPEVDWLLHRAVGPVEPAAADAEALDRDRLVKSGKALWLLPRIRSRIARQQIEVELGGSTAWLIDRLWRQSTASAMRHEEVCRHIAEVAGQAAIPVIFLKGMVLQLGGAIRPGSRMTADIDILVAESQAEELQQRLLEAGCRRSGLRPTEQHLPVITHKLGAQIEIHYRLAGVRLAGGDDATAEACREEGRVRPVAGFPQLCSVTDEELTVAHLLVHALAKHRRAPTIYPGFQVLADLQDLGYSPAGGKTVTPRSRRWIAAEVGDELIDATLTLLGRLEAGERAVEIVTEGRGDEPGVLHSSGVDSAVGSMATASAAAGSSIALLLRHLLAGALDRDYQQSLKLTNLVRAGDGGLRADWFARTWRAVWLTPAQIDILYGKPRTPLGYLGWRLLRPFHLMGKSVVSARAWWKVRRLG